MRRTKDFRRGVELARAKVVAAGLSTDLQAEAIHGFAAAVDRVYRLRDEWDRLGCPVTSAGSQGQLITHPLISALESAERHLAAADVALTRRRDARVGNTSGNRLGQHSAPDRAVGPTRLRKVK